MDFSHSNKEIVVVSLAKLNFGKYNIVIIKIKSVIIHRTRVCNLIYYLSEFLI